MWFEFVSKSQKEKKKKNEILRMSISRLPFLYFICCISTHSPFSFAFAMDCPSSSSSAETPPHKDNFDWKNQLQLESRQRIITKMWVFLFFDQLIHAPSHLGLKSLNFFIFSFSFSCHNLLPSWFNTIKSLKELYSDEYDSYLLPLDNWCMNC